MHVAACVRQWPLQAQGNTYKPSNFYGAEHVSCDAHFFFYDCKFLMTKLNHDAATPVNGTASIYCR